MRLDEKRVTVASVLAAAGTVWPAALCTITDAMRSPYQRALDAAWCGAGQARFEVLGHCPACWAGAAALLLAAAVMLSHRQSPQRAFA